MRSYLKSVVKNMYDSVVEDEYLDPLQQSELYQIINRTYRRISEHQQQNNRKRRLTYGSLNEQAEVLMEICSIINPERQFRILGFDPRIQSVNLRIKTVKEHLQQITQIMTENYPKYRHTIQKSLHQIDNIKGMQQARNKSIQLKHRLKKLKDASYKSKRITELNIKVKNIKATLKILEEIPNIKKMSLIELKGIKERKIRHNEKLKNLDCLRGMAEYIGRVVSEQLAGVIKVLEECLIHRFDSELYENALKNFIVADPQKIKYQRMLIRLVQKQIRRYGSEMGTQMLEICKFYTKIVINLHAVFRWHRENQEQESERIRRLSKQYCQETQTAELGEDKQVINMPNISINIASVTKKIAEVIDQCLKASIIQRMHNPQSSTIYLQTIYLTLRMSEIVQKFAGRKLTISFEQIKNQYSKICKQIKQKALHDLNEALQFQDKNDWNRFPVSSDYSHIPVDKAMYQIWKHKQTEEYHTIMAIISKNSVNVCEKEGDQLGEEEQTWEIESPQLQYFQKFEKYQSNVRIDYGQEVIICQSSLTLLKNLQKCIELSFYFPIQDTIIFPKESPQKLCMPLQICLILYSFYLNYIFNSFLTPRLKTMFMFKIGDMQVLQAKYHKARIINQYPELFAFVQRTPKLIDQKYLKILRKVSKDREITENHTQQSKNQVDSGEKSGLIKCRVVACQSSSYILKYIQHMVSICRDTEETGYNNKYYIQSDGYLNKHKKVCEQLTQIVYTDVIPIIYPYMKIAQLIENIKWGDDIDQHIKSYAEILISAFNDFYFKMKSANKGVVPNKIVDKIFGLFWKTQLTVIMKTFITNYHPKKSSSSQLSKLQFFIDHIYERIMQMLISVQQGKKSKNAQELINAPYIKTKQIFQICLESDWSRFFGHVKGNIDRYQYVYGIITGLLAISEVGKINDEESRVLRVREIQQYILSKIKNDFK